MTQDILTLCDELKLNVIAKRHPKSGWDVRITHPWISNPIVTACQKPTIEEAFEEFDSRRHAIENMRTHIERKNKAREEKWKQEEKNVRYDTDDEWVTRFWKD